MKKFFPILFFGLFSLTSIGQNSQVTSISIAKEEGRCTGSSSCRACSSCNYCKYCNSGGSCGVCSSFGSSSNASPSSIYNSNSSHTVNTANIYYLPDDSTSSYYLKTLMVNIKQLNLRAGPGSNYQVIKSLYLNQELIFLAMIGEWVKVKIKNNGVVGFVHYEYVVVS